jgi:four helix bundle protein
MRGFSKDPDFDCLGLVRAIPVTMAGVFRHEDLVAWQLSRELRVKVLSALRKSGAARDPDFCRQIRKSSRSAPALIAEGFGRFRPKDFARYLRMAAAELAETANHLLDGVESGYFKPHEYPEYRRLAYRASRAVAALIQYLESVPDSDKAQRKQPRPKPKKNRRTEPL